MRTSARSRAQTAGETDGETDQEHVNLFGIADVGEPERRTAGKDSNARRVCLDDIIRAAATMARNIWFVRVGFFEDYKRLRGRNARAAPSKAASSNLIVRLPITAPQLAPRTIWASL